MGVIKRGILGGFSGKVANIIGGSWKGIAYMRSQPLSVANPNTSKQQTQRNALKGCVEFALEILSTTIKPLWDRWASKMSGYNAFVSQNISEFDASGPTDYAALEMSKGSLLAADISSVTGTEATTEVTLEWVDNSGTGNASTDDTVYCVVVNQDQYTFAVNVGGETRGDGTAAIDLPDDMGLGDKLQCYLSFRKQDGTIVSNSSYLEQEVTA